MSLFELIMLAPVGEVETVSDALDALDALSVSVEDADAHTPAEQALFGEPGMPPPKAGWERSRIVALFSTEVLAHEAADLLKAQDFFDGCHVVAVQVVADQDWVRLTQSQFTPVEITPEFWHPTTRMCLKWIAKRAQSGAALGRVLDYGCGSGILAIGAAKFGAVRIDAVDIDPAAVTATQANAEANHVVLNAGLPEKTNCHYDTVLANILASPLQVLAPLLCAHVAAGGHLVLAGILARQAEELKVAYAPYCQLTVTDEEDGWILMTAAL